MKPTTKFAAWPTHWLLCFTLFFLSGSLLPAQGWIKSFGHPTNGIQPYSVTQTQDGGYFLAGCRLVSTGIPTGYFLARTDVNGDTLWTRSYWPNLNVLLPYEGIQTRDGGFGISSIFNMTSQDSLMFLKLDAQGDSSRISKFTYPASNGYSKTLEETADGGYAIGGYFNAPSSNTRMSLTRMDSMGNVLWQKAYRIDTIDNTYGFNLAAQPDGGFALMGYRYNPNLPSTNYHAFLVRTDAQGDTLWTQTYDLATYQQSGLHSIQTADQGYLFADVVVSGTTLLKVDSSGNVQWSKLDTNFMELRELHPTPDGGFFTVGVRNVFGVQDGYGYVRRFDAQGDTLWTQVLRGPWMGTAMCGTATSDGGLLISGFRNLPANFLTPEIYMVKFDSLGNYGRTWIMGNVYEDLNSNCTRDGNEGPLGLTLVFANPGPWYAYTDSLGNYEMNIDTGTYDVFAIPQSSYWGATCPAPNGIGTTPSLQTGDTAVINFGHEIQIYCPQMRISVSTPILRPCSVNTYTFSYQNTGTIDGDSAYVVVEFDTNLTVLSASPIQWRTPQSGNVYIFDLGDVAPGQFGSFQVTTLLDCNVAISQAHCVSAHIYPDSLCDPVDPNWSGASLQVTGTCLMDSVLFEVRNVGTNAMGSPGSYVILEDNIMKFNGNFQLALGDSLQVKVPTNGSTWAFIAEQVPFHPGRSQPRAVVEGCGVDSSGEFSTGFVTVIAMDDEDPFIDIDCRMNVRSWDPNDKQVFPNGTGPDHSIFQQEQLEYLIRFQNTGNDTAFRIVIRDTLSADLDIRTFRQGAASHPYTFRIYGQGIAEWTFDNIQLPDSNVNEPGSHGFVRFSIDQTNGLPIGTRIENEADIYFDFNPPVLTNTAFVTLADSWGGVNIDPPLGPNPVLQVFPNPFSESATFRVAAGNEWGNRIVYRELELEVFDLRGALQQRQGERNVSEIVFERGELPAGLYLFRLVAGDVLLGTGRILIGGAR